MGNQCLASSPLQHYQKFFDNVKSSELKDYWTTIQVYKIKKLYDSSATKHPEYIKHTHLEFEKFLSLFPELEKYPERQKLRIFQLFNFDGSGRVDWNNFYSMISICYFGSDQILATIMFLIFDQSLSKELSKVQIELLCNYNEGSIVTKQQAGDQVPIYDGSEVFDLITKQKQTLQIERWLQVYKNYFNMSKFRRIFNIFIEQKLEKDLIKHFNEYNNLYVESEERYVSYLIDYKWFEAWKLYVKRQYGYTLTSNHKKPMTFKSKKTFKSVNNMICSKVVSDPLTLRQLKFDDSKTGKSTKKVSQQDQTHQEIKNFDFIHNNIGDKPKEINNKVLEGDYQQVIKLDIIENRDYVYVSEKIWKILKRIYEGYPEFRRTGFDFIELYPKILRVLPYKSGSIRYNQQNIKEVSAYYAVQDVLQVILTKAQMENKKYYYKTIGMKKWQQITDLTFALAEISTEVIIYICPVATNQADAFEKRYKRVAKDITELNVGDQVSYEHPVLRVQQKMVFLGKNVEGKFILHIPGQSYIYDVCIMQSELVKKAKYCPAQENALEQLRVKKKQELGLIGIPNVKGLGYINAMIIHFYYNFAFKQQLLLSSNTEGQINMISTLSRIFKDLTNKKQVNTKLISETIEEVLPDFNQFSADMCDDFFHEFLRVLSEQSKNLGMKDYTEQYQIKSKRATVCKKCKNILNEQFDRNTLSLSILSNNEKYYEIIFVPFSQNLKSEEMKRYGFKLKPGAKLKEYKQAFETVAGLKDQNRTYLLMEVYSNNIVKNYSTAKNDVTLDELLLRDTDTIVAYELKLDFADFVARHYSQAMDFQNGQVKIDQFIDCKNNTRGWIFGKICQKDFTPYGHRTIARVIHKFSKGEQWEISYDIDQENVANFPTKSYLNGEQYHLRLQQRYFNEASNDMQICNMPLVVVLANWMRWREFYYMIYLQMRRFINQDHFEDEFLEENQQQNQFQMYSCKSIGSASAKNKKKTQKLKLNKFKQFIYGPKFPYKLKFIDYSGRCAICFKFLKSQVFQGENDTYCQGCQLSTSQPISWQIKVADVMVCVDWKKLDYFKKDVVKDHSSYANLISQRKNDVQTLDNCLKMMTQGHVVMMQQICCNSITETIIKQQIVQSPQLLTIYLQRIIQQNGFIKILNKHVKFNDTVTINNQTYMLYGLISIEGGSNKINKYRKFIMISSEEWLEYDSNIVRCVKKNYLEKLCALNLFYKKKQIQNK